MNLREIWLAFPAPLEVDRYLYFSIEFLEANVIEFPAPREVDR